MGSSVLLTSLLDQFRSIVIEVKESAKSLLQTPTPVLQCLDRLKEKETTIDVLLRRRRSARKSVKSLPKNHQQTVQLIIANPQDTDCIVSVGNCQIGLAELERLHDGNWLNDQIIDGYMYLINQRSKSSPYLLKTHAFNCYLYLKMMQNDFQPLRNHTRRWNIDIFSKHLLLFPISLGNHWTLGCADMQAKRIRYFDSLGGRQKKFFQNIKTFMQQEVEAHGIQQWNWDEWEFEYAVKIPRQQNGYDCGVFLCIYAEYLAKGIDFDFGQADMPTFRNRIRYELLTGELLEASDD